MITEHDERTVLNAVPDRLLIGGEWVEASGGRTVEVMDPATGEVIRTIADASVADGVRALNHAVAAQQSWGSTPPRVRAEILRGAFDLLQERKHDLALLMTLEMGKPLAEAYGEVAYGGEFLRWFSEEAVRIDGRYGSTPEGTGRMIVTHRPVGPAYLITPWNFPLAMATRKIAPALAAGCTMVVKPATLTPLTTLALADILVTVGVPAGVLNVITTTDTIELSDALISDPRLRKVSFTGSTPVGVTLLKQAADNVLRTSMELGGNAPFIVFDDADLELAVDAAMTAKFRNIGQACTAANRFIVQQGIADRFADAITERVSALNVGRGTEPGVDIGPLIDDRVVRNSSRLVDDAVSHGAVLRAGGDPIDGPGTFFQPTVVDRVGDGMLLATEEIFAPIVGIRRFVDEDDAVRIANDTPYGLVGYVFTSDSNRAHRMIDLIDTGMMGLNVGVVSNAAAPFGGVKQSGMGREGGHEGIHEYLETKYTLMPAPYSR
ncbi:NAD-dependent succinate-semialdehyde dehydrogenase [Subtercola vilae]|uniref:NAD-dependent succinate-semialdehyde dehydrogenase n=1 Tax=Subtercola vilae TaxID=2056433 RepID=A0A4T2BEF1_9MICO|nr:NAD-dependent succinate-semialdehyde dehydrogenase [Subtercola vilae]TIH29567.1 NAD-dependent succinate-semialdehyde dehydrogenase [Subtercola vilae]